MNTTSPDQGGFSAAAQSPGNYEELGEVWCILKSLGLGCSFDTSTRNTASSAGNPESVGLGFRAFAGFRPYAVEGQILLFSPVLI